jgi:hypothetical protein
MPFFWYCASWNLSEGKIPIRKGENKDWQSAENPNGLLKKMKKK